MVWEQGSVVIVMLTKLTENGVAMCHRYWPEEGSDLYHIYEVMPCVTSCLLTVPQNSTGNLALKVIINQCLELNNLQSLIVYSYVHTTKFTGA